jgi:hypothetical protein
MNYEKNENLIKTSFEKLKNISVDLWIDLVDSYKDYTFGIILPW